MRLEDADEVPRGQPGGEAVGVESRHLRRVVEVAAVAQDLAGGRAPEGRQPHNQLRAGRFRAAQPPADLRRPQGREPVAARQAAHQHAVPRAHARLDDRHPEIRRRQFIAGARPAAAGQQPADLLDRHAVPQVHRDHLPREPHRVALVGEEHVPGGQENPERPQGTLWQHGDPGSPVRDRPGGGPAGGQVVDPPHGAPGQFRQQRLRRVVERRPGVHHRGVALGQQGAQGGQQAGGQAHRRICSMSAVVEMPGVRGR